MAKSFRLDGLVNPGAQVEQPKERGAQESQSLSNPHAKPKTPEHVGSPKRLSLSLDAETYRQLRLHAVETDRTHQDILADATRAYLRKHAST